MKNIFLSFKRTPYQTFAIILILFFSLFLISNILIFFSFLNSFLNYIETKPQVTIYFKPNTSEDYISKIKNQLIQTGKITNIIYINQKKAFEIYKKLNQDNPLLLEMVSPETMPPSLEIYTKKPEYLEEIAQGFKNKENIDEVQYQANIINKLLKINQTLRIISLVFIFYLSLMTIIVLTIITWFKILLKKDEIDLLRLLGASKFYIRKPYLKENLFLATLSTILSFISFTSLILYFYPFLKNYLMGIDNLYLKFNSFQIIVWPININFLLIVFFISWFFGLLISIFSTYLATNKYLKV